MTSQWEYTKTHAYTTQHAPDITGKTKNGETNEGKRNGGNQRGKPKREKKNGHEEWGEPKGEWELGNEQKEARKKSFT